MPYTYTLKNGAGTVLAKYYNRTSATFARTNTTSVTIVSGGFTYTYYTGYWTLSTTVTLYRGGNTSVGSVSPTVLGDGGYAYNSAKNAVEAQRGVVSPAPAVAYRLTIDSGAVETAPMTPLGGATAAPAAVSDGVAGSASMTTYALTTFTAGAVAAAYATNKVTRRAAAFNRWVLSCSGARPTINRNAAIAADSTTAVVTQTSFTLTWQGDGFTVTGSSKKTCPAGKFYVYCLFADGANVGAAYGFNQALASAKITVSVWTNGVYVPFTRATSASLSTYCTAFSVNEFNILADQTGSFYPKNCCVSPEDQTLSVTFTPLAPYRLRGWSTLAVRPSQPSVLSATGSYGVKASVFDGLHVYLASDTDAFGLIVRDVIAGETLPTGFTAQPVTRCVLDGSTYTSPLSITRKAAATFTATASFVENETISTSRHNAPGAVSAILGNTGAGFSEYTAGALACNTAEYGAYPIYVPAYKQIASNLALSVSLEGSALAAGVVLSARQGITSLVATQDALPISAAPCWCGALAKGLPVIIELDLGFNEGITDTDVAFSVTGIPNATVTWGHSQVYGVKIATLAFSLTDVAAGTAAIVLRGDRIINVTAITPEVTLESSTALGTMTHAVSGTFPMATSPVFGGVTLTDEFAAGDPVSAFAVAIVRESGYTPHRVEVLVGTTVRGVRYVGVEDVAFTVPAGLRDEDEVDGSVPAVTVRLVVRADVCAAPIAVGAIPSIDNGLFSAPIINRTDTVSGLWHVGDLAEVTVTPAVRDAAAFPGLAVFGATYNGTEVLLGDDDTLIVPLDNSGVHVFAVAMAGSVTLATEEDGGEAFPVAPATLDDPPTMEVTGATVVRDEVTYYRLGATVTLTVPPVTNSKTAIYIRHESTLLADGFFDATLADYAYAAVLTLALKGNDTVTVFYAEGIARPWAALAVYDYSAGAYVTTNRPICEIAAVSPHILGPNVAFTASKPGDLTPPDDPDYWDAVNVVAKMQTTDLLPLVRVTVNSPTVPYLLERWVGALWRPANAGSGGITLPDTTFFRLSRGYRADQTVTFTVAAAEDTDGALLVQRPNVSALVSGYWDHTGAPPFAQPVPKGFSVALFAFGATGYRFKEWRYVSDDSVAASSQACQIDIGLAAVSVYPVYEASDGTYADVMVLSGGVDTEAGLWVSKEFVARAPWSALTAIVVRGVHAELCRLIIRNGRSQRTLRADVLDDSADNVAIAISDDGMRRVPIPRGGMSRFHRVAILATGGEVSSVAVATGAQTLKEGAY